MISMNPEILATLDRVPELEAVDRAQIGIEKLGGLTNRNYKVTTPIGTFVLRIPGAGTSEYISRENESLAARITSEIGVNAPLIHFDARDGVQLTPLHRGRRHHERRAVQGSGLGPPRRAEPQARA